MRVLSIMLVLLLATQPLAARYCDMEPSDSAAKQDMPPKMQHGMQPNMHHGMQPNMHHGMSGGPDEQRPGHDCCDAADSRPDRDCDGARHCATCVAGLAALPALAGQAFAPAYVYRMPLIESRVLPSHASPPYRPPTAFS